LFIFLWVCGAFFFWHVVAAPPPPPHTSDYRRALNLIKLNYIFLCACFRLFIVQL